MAYIAIITIPGTNQCSCMKYYYKSGRKVDGKKFIEPGEVAEVPDEELETHLASGKVMQVSGPNSAPAPAKRGRPAKVNNEYSEIYSGQR